MVGAIANVAVGVAAMIVASVLVWMAKRKVRLAPDNSVLASEAAATMIALMLVGLLVIAGALLIKGMIDVVGEAIVGISFGIVAGFVVPVLVCNFLDSMTGSNAGGDIPPAGIAVRVGPGGRST